MLEDVCISFSEVTKKYSLRSHTKSRKHIDGASDRATQSGEFAALDSVSFQVNRGERVAIIGRNGAGKTTLLKLLTGNYAANSGTVEVSGSISSLMDIGLGFHDDFTGRENIASALSYNGVNEAGVETASAEIVEFCELGDFIDQPLRTYSAGMRARLYFATATAIVPDLLIVDEVLGAGDAYFMARCAQRMKKLAASGSALLLVSHSMQQLIEFTDRAIWLESGKIVMDGSTLSVVRAYEEFVQRLSHMRAETDHRIQVLNDKPAIQRLIAECVPRRVAAGAPADENDTMCSGLQDVSRWPSSEKVLVSGCQPLDGESGFALGDDIELKIALNVKDQSVTACRVAVVIFGEDGRWLTRLISDAIDLTNQTDGYVECVVSLSPSMIGAGRYIASVSTHEANDPFDVNSAERYDLVSRSYEFSVRSEGVLSPIVLHKARWSETMEAVK